MSLKLVHSRSASQPVSDQSLMERVAGGSAEAFRELVCRHLASVHRFQSRAAGPENADELTQDTFTRLWNARTKWTPSAPFAQYLFTLAANVSRNHHRGASRRLRALGALEGEPAEPSPSPDHALSERSEWLRVQSALSELPDSQREAIVLRFTAGLESEALGAALGCNASTARSRVFFGLKRLRELLGVHS